MDHLEQIQDPVRKSVDVPFVCASFTFDPNPLTFEEFENFPQRHGYNTHDVIQGVSGQQALCQSISFLQSWLFFGLLVQIFGPIGLTLSRNEFVRIEDDGKPVITTKALPKYMWFWLAVRHHQPRYEIEDHAKLADSCLELANRVTNKLISHELSPGASPTQGYLGETLSALSSVEKSAAESVLLSLVILGETLCYARNQVVPYSVGPTLHWKYPPLGSALLQNAGWCIAEINGL